MDLSKMSLEDLYDLRNHVQSLNQGYPTPTARRNPDLASLPIEQLIQMREAQNPAYWGNNLQVGPVDTHVPLPVEVDQGLSGLGQGATSLFRGAQQRFGQITPAQVDQQRVLDKPLLGTGPGALGSFAGKSIPAAASMVIPGVNSYTGAALTGGILGALEPTGSKGENAVINTAAGVVGGLAGQGASNLIGRVIAPVRSNLSPEQQRLATVLQQNGVPLDAAQQTGSKPLQITNSVFSNLPFTSGFEGAKRGAQRQAFTTAVMAKTGDAAESAAPDVVAGGFQRLGRNFADIYSRNAVKVDDPLLDIMGNAVSASDNAPPIVAKTDKILNLGPNIPGQKYQDVRTQLRTLQGSLDPEVSSQARELKYGLDAAARRSISPQDAALLDKTRQEYANLSTVAKAMKGTTGVSGDVPPTQLLQSVSGGDPRGFVQGKGDLNDLARAGVAYLRDPIPDSGTTQRALYQSLLTGGMGGVGGLLGGDPREDPKGAIEGALAGATGGLLAPMAIQRLLANKAFVAYLSSGPTRAAIAKKAQGLLGPPLSAAGAEYLLQ